MPNKKLTLLVLIAIAAVIVFSPYTITRLTTYGQELLSDDPKYQALETQMTEYQQEEQSALAELEKINAEIKTRSEQVVEAANEPNASAANPAVVVTTPEILETETTTLPVPEETIAPPVVAEVFPLTAPIPLVADTAPAFDPAIAPGIVRATFLLSDSEKTPNFAVRVKFAGVGEKIFETKTNKSGKIELSLTSGRYYGEIIPEDNSYRLQGDAPAFFLPANSEKDLGELYLIKK